MDFFIFERCPSVRKRRKREKEILAARYNLTDPDMIRAQRETFTGSIQILGMVIGEVGMQIRATCILDATEGVRGGNGRVSRTNILTRVSDRVPRI